MIALTVGFVSIACAPARYRPTLPMRAESGDLQLELGQVTVGSGLEFAYRSRSAAAHTIRNAWLTTATRDPCEGGTEAERITINGEVGSALPAGTPHLGVKFERALDATTLDLVVDLDLGEGGCARVPALSQSVAMSAPNRFVMVGSMALAGGQDLRGFRAVFGGMVGGGGWLGRVLLTAEAGVGSALCNTSTCGKDSEGNLRSRVTFPLAAEARYAFEPTVRNTLLSTWLLGGGYTFLPVTVPAFDGERHLGLHGVHLSPGWAYAFMPAAKGPFVNAHRTPLIEVDVPLGLVIDPGGTSRKVGFSGGLTFRMLLPM